MLSEKTISGILAWRNEALQKCKVANQLRSISDRQRWIEENPPPKEFLTDLKDYYEAGNGYKILAKELGLSYTEVRTMLIKWLKFDVRKGTSVVTDRLKERRRDNALGSKSNFYDWLTKYPHLAKKNTKSIQGWYTRKNGKKVWLRSCLEFIYAKWLDSADMEWETEVCVFRDEKETYRPDFFIYKDGQLIRLVEIKGNYFDNVDERSKKAVRIAESNGLTLDVVFDIKPFINAGSNYQKELKIWKTMQKSRQEQSVGE
jgi:hypothetical protein